MSVILQLQADLEKEPITERDDLFGEQTDDCYDWGVNDGRRLGKLELLDELLQAESADVTATMERKSNPNITVQSTNFSDLDEWVAIRGTQQNLETDIKKLKKQAESFAQGAQVEALERLAEVNGLVDVEPAVYPLALAQAKIKTFEFNPYFKIQVSFTTETLDDEELKSLSESLKSEQEALEKVNEAEIDVLLAERALLDTKIAALRTNSKISELQERVGDLRERLTLPVVKSLSLKKA